MHSTTPSTMNEKDKYSASSSSQFANNLRSFQSSSPRDGQQQNENEASPSIGAPSFALNSVTQDAGMFAKTMYRQLDGTQLEYSPILLTTAKRKCDFSSSTGAVTDLLANRELPRFTSSAPESACDAPTPRPLNALAEFATPSQQTKKTTQSRPNSPSGCQRSMPTRSRIASIRRESDCSGENEAAHEKLVKTAQQVSMGFEYFCLDEKLFEERKRAKSLTEPISILTNAFLIQSSSPSPTRSVDTQKQCYSPSTQQVVRNNIPYSPSPSPTPSSPTRGRIMRSMSPIAVRQISKRRYTGSGSGSGLESDGENSLGNGVPAKRSCMSARNAASPLIRDPLSGFSSCQPDESGKFCSGDDTRSIPFYSASMTSIAQQTISGLKPTKFLDASFNRQFCNSPNSVDLDENSGMAELDQSYQSFCSNSVNDNSSTTFSSRAGTPMDEQMTTTEISLNISSGSSSHGSSMSRSDSFLRGPQLSVTPDGRNTTVSNSPIKLTTGFSGNNPIAFSSNSSLGLPFSASASIAIEQQKSASSSPRSYCSSAASPLATGGVSALSVPFQPYANAPILLPSRAIQSTSSSCASSPQSPLVPTLPSTTRLNPLSASKTTSKKEDVNWYLNEPEESNYKQLNKDVDAYLANVTDGAIPNENTLVDVPKSKPN